MNTVTIRFRAKRDTYAVGVGLVDGYKVPALVAHKHLAFAQRDTASVLISKHSRPDAALRLYGVEVPAVVVADAPGAWDVRPIGNGFMADLTLTAPISRASRVS